MTPAPDALAAAAWQHRLTPFFADRYRAILHHMQQAFCLVEVLFDAHGTATDYRFLEVNPAFAEQTGLPAAVGHTMRALIPTQELLWCERLGEVARSGQPQHFEQQARALDGRWYEVHALPSGPADSHQVAILATDITARKRHEAHLAFLDELSTEFAPLLRTEQLLARVSERLATYLHLSRCHLAVADPEADRLDIIFDWRQDEAHLPSMLGAHRISANLTEAGRQHFGAGRPLIMNGRDLSPLVSTPLAVIAGLGFGSFVDIPYLLDGRWRFLLTVARAAPGEWRDDEVALLQQLATRLYARLERAQAEEALQVSEVKYRTLFNSMDQGFGIGEVLPANEPAGVALDYRWLEVNSQFERLTGLARADVLGHTMRQLVPGLEDTWFTHYGQVAATGETVNFEAYSPVLRRWFDVYAFALGPPATRRVAVLFSNTTDRRQAEARYRAQLEQQVAERTRELQENRDLLQSVFDTSLLAMSVLHAVRDEAGQVQDFRLSLVNQELVRQTGRSDLVGTYYAQEYPGIRQVGLFDLMLRVLETGEPQSLEYYYGLDGFDHWFACQFVKLGDGLVATSLDITARKQAEEERLRNLRLLQQAEAVAGMGSWDYDLLSGRFTWSEGMYQLFELPLGQLVEPEIYLRYVVDEDQPRTEYLVQCLRAGLGPYEEILHLRIGEVIKTVRIKTVALHNEQGHPVRLLGVDLDISELRRLEADNLRLRLTQQQALFEAVQTGQEDERRRIAESLHDGLGQVLFATKLQLDLLPPLPGQPARQEAARLLGDAIHQARALSHELSPALLEEFGLHRALVTICQQLASPGLRWQCHIEVEGDLPLSHPLQQTVYRLAQTLAHNVAQHARASEATLEVEVLPGWVVLRVEDNGRGFDPVTVREGLGLKTLRSRVALLGGTVQVDSDPGQGTQVLVRLPLP